MKIRIYYEDTDAQGLVYHANYLKFCERARSEIFFSKKETFSAEAYFVVSQIKANFLKPAYLGDIIEVKTQVKESKQVSLTLFQELYREEELLFSAEIKIAFLQNNKISKIPNKYKEIFLNRK